MWDTYKIVILNISFFELCFNNEFFLTVFFILYLYLDAMDSLSALMAHRLSQKRLSSPALIDAFQIVDRRFVFQMIYKHIVMSIGLWLLGVNKQFNSLSLGLSC